MTGLIFNCNGKKGELRSPRITSSRLDKVKNRLVLNFKCIIYKGRVLIDSFEESHTLRIFKEDEIRRIIESHGMRATEIISKGPNSRCIIMKI